MAHYYSSQEYIQLNWPAISGDGAKTHIRYTQILTLNGQCTTLQFNILIRSWLLPTVLEVHLFSVHPCFYGTHGNQLLVKSPEYKKGKSAVCAVQLIQAS